MRAVLCTVLLSCWGVPIGAQQAGMGKILDPIVVRAQKIRQTDEELTHQVETALHENPYVLSEHITVTTNNSVVTLGGMVLDVWDLITVKRFVRKMRGVSKVVDDIDLQLGGE